MKEVFDPPPLKIRIFKGHSGELIKDPGAKKQRKRKKKMRKEKSKQTKLAIDEGTILLNLKNL